MYKQYEKNIKILNRIYSKYQFEEKECKIWPELHNENKNLCILYVSVDKISYRIDIHKFLWNFIYPFQIYNKFSHKIITTCGDLKCINIRHLEIVEYERKSHLKTYEETWKKMLSKSEITSDGCFIWKGLYNKEYGSIKYNYKNYPIHILSYLINNNLEKLPETEIPCIVRHLCNDTRCFNPKHLDYGSTYDNNGIDKEKNGTLLIGEKNGRAKITEETAILIKNSKYPKDHENYLTQQQRAEKFGTTKTIVAEIDRKRAWLHLEKTEEMKELIEKRKICGREKRKKAKKRVWTKEMFYIAKEKILADSTICSEPNEHTGTPCRIWNGYSEEYGTTCIFGKTYRVHILVCEIKVLRHKEENEIARHLCGNKLCCEETHLIFGTDGQNTIDTLIHNKGSYKTSNETVFEIRRTMNTDKSTNKERAKRFNIHASTLRDIQNGITFKHLLNIEEEKKDESDTEFSDCSDDENSD